MQLYALQGLWFDGSRRLGGFQGGMGGGEELRAQRKRTDAIDAIASKNPLSPKPRWRSIRQSKPEHGASRLKDPRFPRLGLKACQREGEGREGGREGGGEGGGMEGGLGRGKESIERRHFLDHHP